MELNQNLYHVKDTHCAGYFVLVSNDHGKTWADFCGHMNEAWMPRVVNRYARMGYAPHYEIPEGAKVLW